MTGYLLHTDRERSEMLASIGVESVQQLIDDQVPQDIQFLRLLAIPSALDEMELERLIRSYAARNSGALSHVCFMGCGAYDHFTPAAVDEIASRGEYYTSYTPYQAEVSQGNLQVMFEYETLVTQLTGLGISNASLYDGGSAAAEAILMSLAISQGRKRILTTSAVHPQYRATIAAYLEQIEAELVVVDADDSGTSSTLLKYLDHQTACVLVQHPNYFGRLEDVAALAEATHSVGGILVQAFDPISTGILKRPGDLGADIAIAEGQSLGNPLAFGGPYLGVIACRNELVRRLPGRIAGQTVDRRGKRCWVLTLQTREQHIRREKATSNICSNQTLLALRATIYLSLLGPEGLRETAIACHRNTRLAAELIGASSRFELPHVDDGKLTVFKEFVVRDRARDVQSLMKYAHQRGFLAGVPMAADYPGMADCFVVAVTEKRTTDEIRSLVQVLNEAPVPAAHLEAAR